MSNEIKQVLRNLDGDGDFTWTDAEVSLLASELREIAEAYHMDAEAMGGDTMQLRVEEMMTKAGLW